jgi:hypothetical protein
LPTASDPSDSDFEETRKEKLAKREHRRSRGKDVSDTSLEDEEAENEMLDDVALESLSARRGKTRLTAKQKGKRKARTPSLGEEGDGNDADDDNGDDIDNNDGAEGKGPLVTGLLPQEALDEIRKLGDRTVKDAEALAVKYRKSTRTIMVAAGLAVQHSRHSENFANKFKKWYSREHPVRDDREFASNI